MWPWTPWWMDWTCKMWSWNITGQEYGCVQWIFG
jgi:hypothetical protein